MKKIVIIGAGPAGMACAMELSKSDREVTIIEKDGAVGGLSKTIEFKEGDLLFRTDIGPHRFFSKNKYLYSFIEDLIHEEWQQVHRQTRQLIEGKFYDYPINALQAFRNIGLIRSILMLISYVYAKVAYRILRKPIISFEDYVVAHFGRKLAEFNMINYTEKIWGIEASSIHPDWAQQRIKGLNLVSALSGLLPRKNRGTVKTLVDTFYYPQYGTGRIYEAIAKKIVDQGSEILTSSYPTKIKHDNGIVTEIEFKVGDTKQIHQPESVVSSVPMNQFIELLQPPAPEKVKIALDTLQWRAQVYLFLTLDKESVTKDNWIYFPNTEVPFGRISEMKNFSSDMSPKGKTSLFVEFFVTEGDSIWEMTAVELFELALPHFEDLGLFKREEVRSIYSFKKSHVYPVYDLHYVQNLKIVKEYLDSFKNLLYIGRPGRFRYNNQDHSLEMGILAAKSIATGQPCDLDAVGSEDEYFEKGELEKVENNS